MKKKLNNLLKPVHYIPAASKPTCKLIPLIIKQPNDHPVTNETPFRASQLNFSSDSRKDIYADLYADLFELPGSDWGLEQDYHPCLDTMISVQSKSRSMYHINY